MVQNHFELLYGTNLLVSPFIALAKCNLRIAQSRAILTHSNSNFFKGCRIPQLLGLIWVKTNLVFAQISLKSPGLLHVLKIFEFEWVKLVLNWAIVRLHFADAMKGETNKFVPYKSLKWFWTIAVGNQRYLWVLVILWDPRGGGRPPGGP